ncbi:hypothetical protein Pryu01_01268 [Paraliobacillus ryukyuensis]|uniref:Tfp pilus assembly protein PilO n=1 Tax=Paraliobacillus ryukyuensis TaxID=200904 RepID=A0A366EDL4_9BACI|nr:type 4a pilus biogenesis protein PilO [Paraliobacillus ryukyuensis]RBO99498.1 Tfp pilus assembly protein PilO [Paraliobacillus ryukyuensis]
MNLEWNRKHSIALILILLIALIVGLYGYSQFIHTDQAQVNQLKKEIAIQREVINNANENQEALNEANERSKKLHSQLPIATSVDTLLLELEAIEGTSNVNLLNINTGEARTLPENYPSLQSADFQIGFSADSYVNMEKFIRALNDAKQLLEITQLEYTQASEGEGIEATVTISAFESAPQQEMKQSAE